MFIVPGPDIFSICLGRFSGKMLYLQVLNSWVCTKVNTLFYQHTSDNKKELMPR